MKSFKRKNKLNLEIIIFYSMMLFKRINKLNPHEMIFIKNRNMSLIIICMDLINTINSERYIFIVNIIKIFILYIKLKNINF